MIVVKKKKTKLIVALCLSAVLLLSVLAFVLVNVFAPEDPQQEVASKYPKLSWEGENALAYEYISSSAINFMQVKNEKSFYDFYQDEDGNFLLAYEDENGDKQIYYPNIAAEDPAFSYSDLYASDSFGPRLLYLKQSMASMYFGERIEIPADAVAKQNLMNDCGFGKPSTATVKFRYVVKEGTGEDAVETPYYISFDIGDKLINGSGYYVKINAYTRYDEQKAAGTATETDGKTYTDYIYATSSTMLDYAMADYSHYLNGMLISSGLEADGLFGPWLSTMFKEWHNTTYNTPGAIVGPEATVIVGVSESFPADKNGGGGTDGYYVGPEKKESFDLAELKNNPAYASLYAVLNGAAVGRLDTPLSVTLTTSHSAVKVPAGGSTVYEYRITKIESVLTESAENATPGTPVGSHERVKVTYSYKIDGTEAGRDIHGVFDLTDPAIPLSAENAIRAAAVGDTDISFAVTYHHETSEHHQVRLVLTDVVSIYDEKGEPATVVTESSYISYRYYITVDGKKTEESIVTLKISETAADMKAKLLGLKVEKGLELELSSYTEYPETVKDFITYTIHEIHYFIEKELVVAFRFQNGSQRDPYYGESIYENLLTDGNQLYGINNGMCKGVLEFLGGLGTNATKAVGLWGDEVVVVGLTPDVLEKYGLYAYTIYLELPRQIEGLENASEDSLNDDYDWHDTLGFTLYISEVQPDGTRYVASDMYDVVVKFSDERMSFVEDSFAESWARRILLLTDITDFAGMKFETFMTDLYGTYDFDFHQKTIYYGTDGAPHGNQAYDPDTGEGIYSPYETFLLYLSLVGDCSESEATRYLAQTEGEKIDMRKFYDHVLGQSSTVGLDYAGTAYFKELMDIAFLTHFHGILTDAEQQQIKQDGHLLMRMTLSLYADKETEAVRPFRYVFEFYRGDDRRVMVRLYQADASGTPVTEAVSDFYLSTFAFKKLAYGLDGLLNGRVLSNEEGYPEA